MKFIGKMSKELEIKMGVRQGDALMRAKKERFAVDSLALADDLALVMENEEIAWINLEKWSMLIRMLSIYVYVYTFILYCILFSHNVVIIFVNVCYTLWHQY